MSVDLEELERLEQAATKAPWDICRWSDNRDCVSRIDDGGFREVDIADPDKDEDAHLIVAMRNALPSLIAEVRQLRSDAETRAKFDAIAEKIKDICERQLAAANEATMRAIAERDALKAENERLRASIRHRTDAVIARGIYATAYRDGLGVAETEITEWLQSEGHHEIAKRIVAQEHYVEGTDTRRIDRVAELEAENERLRASNEATRRLNEDISAMLDEPSYCLICKDDLGHAPAGLCFGCELAERAKGGGR